MARTRGDSAPKNGNQTKADISEGGNDRWRLAIDAITSGLTDAEAAALAGVSRQTVSHWRHHNELFKAALNRRRGELRDAAADRLAGLVERVEGAVEAALLNPETLPGVVISAGLAALPKLHAMIMGRPIGPAEDAIMIRQGFPSALDGLMDPDRPSDLDVELRRREALRELSEE